MKGVVVGVDGSSNCVSAVDFAAAEAAMRDLPLSIVHVRESDPWRLVGQREDPPIDPDRVLREACRRAADRYPSLTVSATALDGHPASVLIELSADAQLTVVGSRGRGGFLGLAAGSVCIQLAGRGRGPVVVSRGTWTGHVSDPVVVGIDAAAPARDAIDFAFTEAALRGVSLEAVYAWSQDTLARAVPQPAYNFAGATEQAILLLAGVIGGWVQRYPMVTVEPIVEHSLNPPAAMLAASRRAGLVVVGAHGTGALRRLLLGSVVQTLAHHCDCPLAVVHATDHRPASTISAVHATRNQGPVGR